MKKSKNKRLELISKEPMSNHLIEKYLDNRANIKAVCDLDNYNDLDDIFEGEDHIILLIEHTKKNNGHWVCMFKNPTGIYYHNSYGKNILEELKDANYRKFQSDHLLDLVNQSNKDIYYNDVPYQSNDFSIATCGRHALLPVVLNKLIPNFTLKEYHKIMREAKKKYNMDYDKIVSHLIDKIR